MFDGTCAIFENGKKISEYVLKKGKNFLFYSRVKEEKLNYR